MPISSAPNFTSSSGNIGPSGINARVALTSYTNNTGKPLFVVVTSVPSNTSSYISLSCVAAGISVISNPGIVGNNIYASIIVPPGLAWSFNPIGTHTQVTVTEVS